MAVQVQSVQQARSQQARRIWSTVAAGSALAFVFGVVSAKLTGGGLTALAPINPPNMPGGIVVFALLLLVPAAIRWPRGALVALLAATTLVDQFALTITPGTTGTTIVGPMAKVSPDIPFFRSLTTGSFVTPAEMVILVLLIIWLAKGARDHCWHVPRSPLAKSIAAMYVVTIVVGAGLGVAHHGQFKEIIWEARPWYLVAVMYLLTSSFFAGRDIFRTVLWTIVLGSGAKSLEGVFYYFDVARKMNPRPQSILAHEESFFFGLFLLATLALWLFQMRGRLRSLATALVPLVMIADLGNSRRDAFLLLYVGMAALLVMAFVGMPERRRVLKRMNAVVAIGAIVYLGLFWNDGGTLGQPARAVHSAVAPDARDQTSDQYRVVENADLVFNIHATRSIGQGFGVRIDYIYPITDLTNIDPQLAFVTHDTLLYVWYRLGILGEVVLWSVVGFGIVTGCRLVKGGDRETAVLGALGVCAIMCWVLMGYNDLGFAWLRIAVFMGFMLGALEVSLQRLGQRARPTVSGDRVVQDVPAPAEPALLARPSPTYSLHALLKEG